MPPVEGQYVPVWQYWRPVESQQEIWPAAQLVPPPVGLQDVVLETHAPLQLYWPLGQLTGHGGTWHQPLPLLLPVHQTWSRQHVPAVPPVVPPVVPVEHPLAQPLAS